jgi:hypothetical protein
MAHHRTEGLATTDAQRLTFFFDNILSGILIDGNSEEERQRQVASAMMKFETQYQYCSTVMRQRLRPAITASSYVGYGHAELARALVHIQVKYPSYTLDEFLLDLAVPDGHEKVYQNRATSRCQIYRQLRSLNPKIASDFISTDPITDRYAGQLFDFDIDEDEDSDGHDDIDCTARPGNKKRKRETNSVESLREMTLEALIMVMLKQSK